MTIETVPIESLYIETYNEEDGRSGCRKLTQILETAQRHFDKAPDKFIAGLKNNKVSKIKKKKEKNKGEKEEDMEIAKYQAYDDIQCLRCKTKTGNIGEIIIFKTKKGNRAKATCSQCKMEKSTYIRKKD